MLRSCYPLPIPSNLLGQDLKILEDPILRATNLLPPPDHSKDLNLDNNDFRTCLLLVLVEYWEIVVFKVVLVYLRLAQKCDKIADLNFCLIETIAA